MTEVSDAAAALRTGTDRALSVAKTGAMTTSAASR